MPSNEMLMYMIGITGGVFAILIVAYFLMQKKLNKSDLRRIKQLREGTKEQKMSSEVIYQKLYVIYKTIPFVKRYTNKLRRKLEIINIDDEYLTRKQVASILTKGVVGALIVTILIFAFAKEDALLLCILLLFEVFFVETLMSGMVDKLDTKLLKQQVDFFAEIRHAYHEFNMVEEAIYEVSQNDELEVSRQGEKIYEILISDDPETELEKYYDVAPNSYLKEFAGVSHLTREFGDRKDKDGASLYLKNLNNITEEMQLEILKREKLDYVFQSLSFIAIVPVLCLQPLRNWAVDSFGFTKQFYDGKQGLIVQILIILLTFICYILTRKLKDSGAIKDEYKDPNQVWQMKLYNKNAVARKFLDLFIPKQGTKEHRVMVKLMKEAATKQKVETIYINKMLICILTFIASIAFLMMLHKVTIDYIYNEPTSDYNVLGQMSDRDYKAAMEKTEQDNYFLEIFKKKSNVTKEYIYTYISQHEWYGNATEQELTTSSERLFNKLQVIKGEYMKWFEILLAFLIAVCGYASPKWMLMFQKILRKLEMENEVMQFQTIILMLMKIERVNVEMILEWLERYSNIFREPITKCVNNYESGAWEALEELKSEIAFPQLIRIVESLQAAVEQIPISEAFDELDNEREYYKAKREDSNERLISRKGLIGKVVGFAPLIGLFVGYLIVPLVLIGLTSMSSSMSSMQTMM